MVRVRVHVKTGCKEASLIWDAEAVCYRACLTSQPEKNKANRELLKLFKNVLGKDARLVRGATSKEKIIEC